MKGIEAVVGDGEGGKTQKLTVSLEEIARESDSDNKNNKKVDDAFDNSFIALGVDSLDLNGRDHKNNTEKQWKLTDVVDGRCPG